MSQPITLYSHASGPNPWKVAIILEELGLKYDTKIMDMADLKKEPYEKLNPNGRVPCIIDPNTNITLWESGAIIEYLIDTYDKSNILHPTSFPEKYHAKQWLLYQASGQGPYFGQAAWFTNFHHEKLPSAVERYQKEVDRVTMVLDRVLSHSEYLVGDKCTYADLSFVPWYTMVGYLDKEGTLDLDKKYPHWSAWNKKLNERPAVKKVFEDKAKAMAAEH